MSVLSPSKTASLARPYWNAATCYGTARATTTLHEQYNKRDYVYSYGRCHEEFVRQDGQRGRDPPGLPDKGALHALPDDAAGDGADGARPDQARPGRHAGRARRGGGRVF